MSLAEVNSFVEANRMVDTRTLLQRDSKGYLHDDYQGLSQYVDGGRPEGCSKKHSYMHPSPNVPTEPSRCTSPLTIPARTTRSIAAVVRTSRHPPFTGSREIPSHQWSTPTKKTRSGQPSAANSR